MKIRAGDGWVLVVLWYGEAVDCWCCGGRHGDQGVCDHDIHGAFALLFHLLALLVF